MPKTKTKAVKKSVTKKVLKEKVVDEPKYELSISICNEVLSTKTDDITEAILTIKPKKLTGKILFTVKRGESSITRVIYPFQARKLFNNRMTAEFFTKNIILQLK